MLASVCKNTITSVIVSGFGMSPSAGYQFGLVTGPPFPQSVLHFCSFISFRQGEFWNTVFDCGMATPFLHLMPCHSTGGGLYKFFLPTVGHFIQGPSLWVLKVSQPRDLCYFLEGHPNSHVLRLYISIHSAGPQIFSPVFLPSIPVHASISPSHPFSHPGP